MGTGPKSQFWQSINSGPNSDLKAKPSVFLDSWRADEELSKKQIHLLPSCLPMVIILNGYGLEIAILAVDKPRQNSILKTKSSVRRFF